jgi:hypothetical protein
MDPHFYPFFLGSRVEKLTLLDIISRDNDDLRGGSRASIDDIKRTPIRA